MRYIPAIAVLAGLVFGAFAQPARVGGSGEKSLVIVPMTGTGTWADPRRPALPRDAGASFRYVLSDDGNTAIVELSGGAPPQREKIEAELSKDARVKVFRPSKDKKNDVENEIRKIKKDFDLDSFGKGPAAALAANPR